MKRKLVFSLWVFYLCACAGFVNAISFEKFLVKTGHHSGNFLQLAQSLVPKNFAAFVLVLSVVCFFFLGSFLGGLIFPDDEQRLRTFYSAVPFCFAGLSLALQCIPLPDLVQLWLICVMLGVQNSLPIRFNGAKVRTTHMTGNVTDSAFFLGKVARGEHFAAAKSLYYFSLFFAFFAGSVAGVIAPSDKSYLIMAASYSVAGLVAKIFL